MTGLKNHCSYVIDISTQNFSLEDAVLPFKSHLINLKITFCLCLIKSVFGTSNFMQGKGSDKKWDRGYQQANTGGIWEVGVGENIPNGVGQILTLFGRAPFPRHYNKNELDCNPDFISNTVPMGCAGPYPKVALFAPRSHLLK